MGKIWIKAPDGNKQCCGCEGKKSPCDNCSSCDPYGANRDQIVNLPGLPSGTLASSSSQTGRSTIIYSARTLIDIRRTGASNDHYFKINVKNGETVQFDLFSPPIPATCFPASAGCEATPCQGGSFGTAGSARLQDNQKADAIFIGSHGDGETHGTRRIIQVACPPASGSNYDITFFTQTLSIGEGPFGPFDIWSPDLPPPPFTNPSRYFRFIEKSIRTETSTSAGLIFGDTIEDIKGVSAFGEGLSNSNSTHPCTTLVNLACLNSTPSPYTWEQVAPDVPEDITVSLTTAVKYTQFYQKNTDGTFKKIAGSCVGIHIDNATVTLLGIDNAPIDIKTRLVKLILNN